MYPFIILGVVALVTFIILQTTNRNDIMNAGVSLVVGVIVTYLIVYLRMSDRRRDDRRYGDRRRDDDKKDDDKRDRRDRRRDENDNFLFWFNPKY